MKRTENSLDSHQILNVIEKYSKALELLDSYDHQTMKRPKGNPATYALSYNECIDIITQMRYGAESDLFGKEKDDSFKGSIGNIYQSFAGQELYPTLEEKIAMINNTIPVCQALEIEDPKAAAVCAVEVLNPSMQPTLDAASLAIMSQRGQFKGITVDGPLALDNALNEDAARHKGIKSPVAGHADVLLMPNIECGNIMWKTLVYMARCEIAGVLMGAAAPVVITSRSDAPETKLNSIALALLIAGNKDKK